MRLTYLCADPGVPYGGVKGAAVHVAELVAAFVDEGCEVLLLMAEVVEGATPPPGVRLARLPWRSRRTSTPQRLASEAHLAEWIAERLDDFGADVLYERFALHTAAGAAAARRCGLPHLLELNAPLRQEAAAYRTLDEPAAAQRLEHACLAGADVVFAVTAPLARWAHEAGARRVELLPNAVAADRFATAPRRTTRTTAVFAGSLRPWHGVEVIADAWRLLGGGAPDLLVVGDGPGRALLQAAGARLTGAVPHRDVPRLLATADIGLAPYTVDGPRYFSPLKVFEYLAAGLAVVAGDLPGVTEPLPADALVPIPAGDAAALAAAVAGLAADPARRRRLGARGRAAVQARHTWRHRARQVCAAVPSGAGSRPAAVAR